MTPTDLPHVSVTVSCATCRTARAELDRMRRLVIDMQTRADAERRHSADLEARIARARPSLWER